MKASVNSRELGDILARGAPSYNQRWASWDFSRALAEPARAASPSRQLEPPTRAGNFTDPKLESPRVLVKSWLVELELSLSLIPSPSLCAKSR